MEGTSSHLRSAKSNGPVTSPTHDPYKKKKTTWNTLLKYRIVGQATKYLTPTDERLRFIDVGKNFCSRTSSQGITQVYKAPKGSKKLFWLIISVSALVLLVVHLYHLISQFLRFDTTTEVTVVPSKLLEFPAVTVCNSNMVKATPFASQENKNLIRDHKYDDRLDYLNRNNSSLGHQKNDLIVKALFDYYKVDIDQEFTLRLNGEYGNCFTFNINNIRKTRRSMPGYGLQLLLNVEQYSYNNGVYRPTEWVGAIIKVHHPHTEPIPQEGGISVAPNTLNRLAIKKTVLNRLGGLYGDCLSEDNDHPKTYYSNSYTKQQCENTCLQREIITNCCCYIKVVNYDLSEFNSSWPAAMTYGVSRWDVCIKERVGTCLDNDTCWDNVWRKYDDGTLSCAECLDQCKETIYDVETTAVEWPSKFAMPRVVSELQGAGLANYSISNDSVTPQFVQQNFLKVQIYFTSLTTTFIREIPVTGNFEFVSELGGTFGLWVGWTILTVFEFLEFVSDLIALYLLSHKKVKYKDSNNNGMTANSSGETYIHTISDSTCL